ncbi:MAG: NAD(P)/FAD-dependent oxidoreductase [Actinobacteria bacterium]|nr:NAD(P)/FAD-dependent oxidoreductase [Actinomycetota bacterium]
MGADVLLVDPAPVPLQRVLGDDIGAVFRRLHTEHGVALRLGAGVRELRGTKDVEAVVLDDGRVEAADVVVVGRRRDTSHRARRAEGCTHGPQRDCGRRAPPDRRPRASTRPGTSPTPGTPATDTHLRVEHRGNAPARLPGELGRRARV